MPDYVAKGRFHKGGGNAGLRAMGIARLCSLPNVGAGRQPKQASSGPIMLTTVWHTSRQPQVDTSCRSLAASWTSGTKAWPWWCMGSHLAGRAVTLKDFLMTTAWSLVQSRHPCVAKQQGCRAHALQPHR